MKKIITVVAVVAILVGGGAFYGGMKYAEGRNTRGFGGNFQNLQNLSPEERQQRVQELGANAGAGFRGSAEGGQGTRTAGGGFVAGEILSKDNASITIKMPDGGSRIIFYSDSTEISKFTEGTAGDLSVGNNVSVNGSSNQDGSVTARTIQIRSAVPEN